MTIAKLILPEIDDEMARTRAILPAEGLHTIGWNANHLAEIVGWTQPILLEDEFDVAPVGGKPYETPSIDEPAEILAAFKCLTIAVDAPNPSNQRR